MYRSNCPDYRGVLVVTFHTVNKQVMIICKQPDRKISLQRFATNHCQTKTTWAATEVMLGKLLVIKYGCFN